MFRNYVATAVGNLARNKLYAAITILGLAVAFTVAILVGQFVRNEFSYNHWIPGHERIYKVRSLVQPAGQAPLVIEATAGLAGRVLETAGGARAGAELEALVEHALRLRSLMGFVPRRYDPAIVEALALAGALDPDLTREARAAALLRTAQWLDHADREAKWTAALADDGHVEVNRVWRGVTDNHKIEASFLTSAEARKLADHWGLKSY